MINEFLDLYTKNNTKVAYRSAVYQFLESVYGKKRAGRKATNQEMVNFETLAVQYFKDKRDIGKDLQLFALSFKDKPPMSARLYLSGVKEFFIFHNINVTPQENKNIKKSMPKGSSRTIEEDLDQTTIRTIISHMDIKGKALLLTLASSGMRIGESLSLPIDDIELKSNPSPINIRGSNSKNGENRITFISNEAKEAIIEWLKVRAQYIESSQNKNAGLIKNGDIIIKEKIDSEDRRLFPFSMGVVTQFWENALRKANLLTHDTETGRKQLHIHQLRKFFRSQLALGCPVDLVEALMGHEGYLTGAYRRYTRKQMSEFYLKNEHLLYINMPEDVGKIRTEFRQEMDSTNSIVKGLVLENQSLKLMMENVKQLLVSEIGLDISKSDFPQKLEEFRKKELSIWKTKDTQ